MGGAVFPPCCLAWGQTINPHLQQRLLQIHRQVWLSLLWGHCSFLLVHAGFICALQESVSPVLWKFCNQIPLASKVKVPEGSQSLCRTPRLGSVLWVIELSYQYENFFGIIFCSFWVVCLVTLWWVMLHDPGLTILIQEPCFGDLSPLPEFWTDDPGLSRREKCLCSLNKRSLQYTDLMYSFPNFKPLFHVWF